MLDRYADYHALDLDSPADRILRISFNKPETHNSLDKEGHHELTYIWREIDEDDEKHLEKEVQQLTDKYIEHTHDLQKKKEEELMSI